MPHVNQLGPRAGGIYSSALVHLPTPRMVLFYNGPGVIPGYLHLSDAYADSTNPDVEVHVRVINITSGQDHILELCRPLQDYTTFVETFQRYSGQNGISDRVAASMAIAALQPGEVQDYLRAHEAEVIDMLLTEYDEAKTLKAEYYAGERAGVAIGREEGRKEGLQQGRLDILYDLAATGDLPIEAAVRRASAPRTDLGVSVR